MALEAVFEGGDCLDADFEAAGKDGWRADAIAEQLEKAFEVVPAAQGFFEVGLELLELGVTFFYEEDVQRSDIVSGDEVNDASGVAVEVGGGGEVGFVDCEGVFCEVMEAVHLAPDGAAQLSRGEGWRRSAFARLIFEEFEDSLGGDGIGVVTVGQDAAFSAAPGEATDLFLGSIESFLEQGVPGMGAECVGIAVHARHEEWKEHKLSQSKL